MDKKLLFLFVCVLGIGMTNGAKIKHKSMAQSRFFNIFNIVKFSNEVCETDDDDEEKQGVCYSNWECDDKGGDESGDCASGFGKCCVITRWDDGTTVDEPVSYFQNEDFSSDTNPEGGNRVFTVSISNEDVCQVRVDFDTFDLAPPTTYGECDQQSITIDDSPAFCGDNEGQNYYVHVDRVPYTFDITMNVESDDVSYSYTHNLRITQVDCASSDEVMTNIKAPRGCTQYFNETSGTIKSFNYDGTNMYAQNLDYTICVANSDDACGVKYKASEDTSVGDTSIGAADMSTSVDGGGACQATGDGNGATGTAGCGENCLIASLDPSVTPAVVFGDWLTIGEAQIADFTETTSSLAYKAFFCGQGLGVPADGSGNYGNGIKDYSGGPFVLHFHTNDNNAATASSSGDNKNNLGFAIDYSIKTGQCN